MGRFPISFAYIRHLPSYPTLCLMPGTALHLSLLPRCLLSCLCQSSWEVHGFLCADAPVAMTFAHGVCLPPPKRLPLTTPVHCLSFLSTCICFPLLPSSSEAKPTIPSPAVSKALLILSSQTTLAKSTHSPRHLPKKLREHQCDTTILGRGFIFQFCHF